MALLRTFVDDASHVRQKAHIEHPIRFVQHEISNMIELDSPLL
jgi:hypothetical protein